MATNLPTIFQDSAARAIRESETPLASFTDGLNPGASNAGGIGINTGGYDPKDSDWAPMDPRIEVGQYIGGTQSGLNAPTDAFGPNTLVAWSQATSNVSPDGVIDSDVGGSGFASVNRTGTTIAAGEWAWGVAENP
jgi:hypothetical protein